MNCSIGQSWYRVQIPSKMTVRAKTRSKMLDTWLDLCKTYIQWLIFASRFGWSWSHVGIPSGMVIHARSKVQGPWSLILVPRSMILDPILDTWSLIFDLWSMIHDPWSLILDPWSLILDPWSMILDPWSIFHDWKPLLRGCHSGPVRSGGPVPWDRWGPISLGYSLGSLGSNEAKLG